MPQEVASAVSEKLKELDGNMSAAERFFELSRASILAIAAGGRVHYGTLLRAKAKLGLMTDDELRKLVGSARGTLAEQGRAARDTKTGQGAG